MVTKDNLLKAKIISQALPYIQNFHNKIIIIKLGGSTLDKDPKRLMLFIQDVVLLKTVGIHPILIHGGGKKISDLTERLGKKSKFISGLRITDSDTMEITQMVLAGLINKNLVSLIQQKGGKAIGISGKDGNLALAYQIGGAKKIYGQVGEIKTINTEIIDTLISNNYIPVISSIADDKYGKSLNINADTFAAEIAISLKAEKLIFISNVLGVMKDVNQEKSLYHELKLKEIPKLIKKKIISQGMIPKLLSSQKALINGVKHVHFISEEIHHALLVELFTEQGIGTKIYKK